VAVVAALLDSYVRGAFDRLPMGFSVTAAMEQILEDVSRQLHPDWDHIPWLVRCDVLMTYPHMAAEEQLQLMRLAMRAVATSGGSAIPPEPTVMLAGYLSPEQVPTRGTRELSFVAYRTVRVAFERHKKDGVRRLCRCTYAPRDVGSCT